MPIDAVVLVELVASMGFSFIFFFLALYEGVWDPEDFNLVRAFIFHFISLFASTITVAMSFSLNDNSWGLAFGWIFIFIIILNLIVMILSGLAAFLYLRNDVKRKDFRSRRRND